MTLTPERLAAMQAGRERRAEEDRRVRGSLVQAYSAWCRRDARLWSAYRATDGRRTPEGAAAYEAWYENLCAMPRLP